MPVILPPDEYDTWLDPKVKDAEVLLPLLKPFGPAAMSASPVSTMVNSPRYDGLECVAEVSLA